MEGEIVNGRVVRTYTAALGAALLAVGLAACGSSGGSGSPSTSATPAAAATSTGALHGAPIKIGMIGTVDNPELDLPEQPADGQAAIRGINATGGIDGHPAELDFCNGQTNPNDEAACARKLVADGVVAIGGGFMQAPPEDDPIFDAAGIARVGVNAIEATQYNSPYYFLLDPGSVMLYQADLEGLKLAGVKSVYVVVFAAPTFAASLSQFKQFGAHIGVKVVGSSVSPLTTTDMSTYALKAAQSGAGGAIIATTDANINSFVTNLRSIKPSMVIADGPSLWGQELQQLGTASNGMIASLSLPPATDLSAPGIAQFNSELKAEFNAGDKNATLAIAGDTIGLQTWTAVHAIAVVAADLLKEGKPVNASTVLQEFRTVQNLTAGAVVDWTPSTKGPAVLGTSVSRPELYEVQVRNGQIVVLPGQPINVEQLFGLR